MSEGRNCGRPARDRRTDALSADDEHRAGGTPRCLIADARERQRGWQVTAAEDQQPRGARAIDERLHRAAGVFGDGQLWSQLLV
jgi:hypothetical protein